jgi:cytoskeletal protein RodZ
MAATIGEQLRLAREGRGIPLREISDQTRISMHYLEAIEANDYKRLPGGIFNRSFVKAYARYVGYDEKEAVEAYTRYMRESGEPGEDVVSTPHQSKVYTDLPATRSPLLTVVLAIVILAILTAMALGVLRWVQRRSAGPAVTGFALTGTAGVSPASSNKFTLASTESDTSDKMAFNENGRDARGPSKSGFLVSSFDIRKADYEQFLQ